MIQEIEFGYCQCGCGQKTSICDRTFKKRSQIKGEPRRFIQGHNGRVEGLSHGNGYLMIRAPENPRANSAGRIREHVLIAEKALGKYLSPEVEVHHFNGIKTDNRNENLVICPNNGYHMILHRRQRAFDATGNPNYRKCTYCKKHDDPAAMLIVGGGISAHHTKCYTLHEREYRANKKAAKLEMSTSATYR